MGFGGTLSTEKEIDELRLTPNCETDRYFKLRGIINENQDEETNVLTPKTALLTALEFFKWKLMEVVIATMLATSTTTTSPTPRIFCTTSQRMQSSSKNS